AAHDPAYLAYLASTAGSSGYIDADTYYSEHTYDAARRAAGGCIALVDALSATSEERPGLDYGLALVRPPGHHATANRAMGFCMLNHVAIAARAAISRGVEKVAILDWDVHHGNGTQDI